jgi:anti-anti-sigma factor
MFSRIKHGSVDVVASKTALTRDTVDKLQAALDACRGQGQPRAVLDLHKTPLVDSAALEQLLDAQEAFEQEGGALKLAGANALCSEILSITGVAGRFEIFGDVKSAVGSFVQ